MNRRILFRQTAALTMIGIAGASGAPAWAKDDPVYTGLFSKLALGGHDPVAYFNEGKPVKGDARFELEHMGAKWLFATAANRDAFKAAPERYAPQYGGYCAWAISQGKTASGDPQFWKIVDNKLYLNFSADVQKTWEKDIPGYIQRANTRWPSVLGK